MKNKPSFLFKILLIISFLPGPGWANYQESKKATHQSGHSESLTWVKPSSVVTRENKNYLQNLQKENKNLSLEDDKEFKSMVSKSFFETSQKKIAKAVSYEVLEDRDSRERLLLDQWKYLELYKIFRMSYLMVNFVQNSLYLDFSNQEKIISEFKSYVPLSSIENYPYLQTLRVKIINYFNSKESQNDRYDLDEKSEDIFSQYILLKVTQAKKEYDYQIHKKGDEALNKKIALVETQEMEIRQSYPILLTNTFQENVEPIFSKMISPLLDVSKRKAYFIINKLEEHLKPNVRGILTAEQLKDLIVSKSNEGVKELLKPKGDFSQKEFMKFRSLIKENMSKATDEVLGYQEEEFQNNLDILNYDFAQAIIRMNTTSSSIDSELFNKLNFLFSERPIDNHITRDYKSLKKAREILYTEYIKEKVRISKDPYLGLFIILGLTLFLPGQKAGSTLFKNYSLAAVNSLRTLVVLGIGGSASHFVYKYLYSSYRDYKRSFNIARLSMNGQSLVSLLSADHFLHKFGIFGTAAGIKSLILILGISTFFKDKGSRMGGLYKKIESLLMKKIPKIYGVLKGLSSFTLQTLKLPLHKLQQNAVLKETIVNTSRNTVSLTISLLVTSFFLAEVFKALDYISHSILDVSFNFIQSLAVNQKEVVERHAFEVTGFFMNVDRLEIQLLVDGIERYRNIISNLDPTTSDYKQQLKTYKEMIAIREETIRQRLKWRITDWVNFIEYRKDYNRVFEENKDVFTFELSPDEKNFTDIRLTYKSKNGDVYSTIQNKKEIKKISFSVSRNYGGAGLHLEDILGSLYGKFLSYHK